MLKDKLTGLPGFYNYWRHNKKSHLSDMHLSIEKPQRK